MVHIPSPGWVWNLERRKQWKAALNEWRKIDNIVILVELPPASEPEAVLLAENIPNLVWLADGKKAKAADTREQLRTLRHARCNLVGAFLNHEPPAPPWSRFPRWLGCLLFLLAAHSHAFCGNDTATPARTENAEAAVNTPPVISFSVPTAANRAAWQQRLTLGPGDLLNISYYGQPELTRSEVPIGPDGRIGFLEVHNVMAAGLTIDELRTKLESELGAFRRAPRVMIAPAAFRSKKYVILGKINQKGVFTLDRPLTVIEAVARAGGLETGVIERQTVELADLSRSFLVRQGKKLPVDFQKLFGEGDLSQNIPMEPEDYLYFPPSDLREVYVLGEITFPGTVGLGADTTALQAVASRGGFTTKAWKRRVLVVRGSLNHPEVFVVNLADVLSAKTPDLKLQPRDIVYVSGRPWIKAEELLDTAATAFIESMVITWTGLHVDPFK